MGSFHRNWRIRKKNKYVCFFFFATGPMLSYFTVRLFGKILKGCPSLLLVSPPYISAVIRGIHISQFTKLWNRLEKKLGTTFPSSPHFHRRKNFRSINTHTHTYMHTYCEENRSIQRSSTYFTASQVQRCIQLLIF